MKVPRRSRRLARVGGCAALALGMAGTAGPVSAPARARVTAILIKSHVVAGWGYNAEGQLGDGTITSRSGYGDIRVGNDVVQVAAGSGHGLAVRSDGNVWAWGFNGSGELGDGTRTSRSTPVQVTGLTGVTQVAAGGGFSMALRSDGTVWAWGDNRAGQLGPGTTSSHVVTPVKVTGLASVTKISAGGSFALALLSDGTVRAWGDNRRGQLGNGTTASSPVPVKVAGLSQVTGISAGYDASIATRTSGISALTSVWTWGGNDFGQLGDGTLTSRSTPERVTGLPLYIVGISAGGGFAAFLGAGGSSATGGFATVLGTDGTVWAWGDDSAGQLGNAPSSTPVTRPVNTIGTGSGITQLSAGDFHMLALKSNGTVLAWGGNAHGQLGNGSTAQVTGPVQVTGLTNATQVAAGEDFSLAVHTVPYLLGT
jgi:alpha-tubulin suppressor-like RCC1 family protein